MLPVRGAGGSWQPHMQDWRTTTLHRASRRLPRAPERHGPRPIAMQLRRRAGPWRRAHLSRRRCRRRLWAARRRPSLRRCAAAPLRSWCGQQPPNLHHGLPASPPVVAHSRPTTPPRPAHQPTPLGRALPSQRHACANTMHKLTHPALVPPPLPCPVNRLHWRCRQDHGVCSGSTEDQGGQPGG